MMRYFHYIDADGNAVHREVDLPEDATPEDILDMGINLGEGWCEIPCLPGDNELWDCKTGTFTFDTEQFDLLLGAKIDAGAGATRLLFITDIPGQQTTYKRKEEQARAYLVDQGGTYPLLEAEATATDRTVADLVAEVVAIADYWIALDDAIEAARRGAKHALKSASTLDTKRAASIVDWPAIIASVPPNYLRDGASPINTTNHSEGNPR